MGKIIAICNQKGGVGKTTTAVNISAFLAEKGKKILLIDADPQANATSGIGLNKRSQSRSTYDLFLGSGGPEEIVQAGPAENFYIIPSNVALTGAEIELVEIPRREFILRESLAAVRGKFDYIFIDCPPSLGLITLNCLVAADSVLIPLQCEYYALEGLTQLMDTITLVSKGLNPALEIAGVVLTMADFRTRLTDEVIKEVRRYFREKVFHAIIPRSVRLSEAPGFGKPIALYDRASLGAQRYEALTLEFLNRQGGGSGGSILSEQADSQAVLPADAECDRQEQTAVLNQPWEDAGSALAGNSDALSLDGSQEARDVKDAEARNQ